MRAESDVRILVQMPRTMLAALDDYRYSARVPSRSEAIRRLVETALKASGITVGAPELGQPGLGQASPEGDADA